jgi:NTE family protein
VDRCSSVSGGSITAGVLAFAWPQLDFRDGVAHGFHTEVVKPVRALAGVTLDWKAVVTGALLPRRRVGDQLAEAYRKRLFGERTLQDLPEHPRFVFNATNVQSGALWRFSRPYMADWRVGRVDAPRTPLAAVVAASSAFPPVMSPYVLPLDGVIWKPGEGTMTDRRYRSRAVLTDGGVYDNLGLETVWKRCRTVLVSDGGGHMADEPFPAVDWARHGVRVSGLLDHQVRNLRKRQLIEALGNDRRAGAYWGIRTNIAHYGLPDAFDCPHDATMRLAGVPTRLAAVDERLQERIINWGFAVCDAALRRWVDPAIAAQGEPPYPRAGA